MRPRLVISGKQPVLATDGYRRGKPADRVLRGAILWCPGFDPGAIGGSALGAAGRPSGAIVAVVLQQDIFFKDFCCGADENQGPMEWFERFLARHPQ